MNREQQLKLIEHANIGTIPDAIKPLLVKYIKNSPVPITKDNVAYFLRGMPSGRSETTARSE